MAETGLLAAIQSEVKHRGSTCAIALIPLTDDERAELDVILADRHAFPGSAVAKGLQKLGHNVNDFTVNRHRRGDCTCGDAA